jgi:hypothetical protein
MAALVFVGVVAVAVGVLVGMGGGLVAVLMAIVHMRLGPMGVLMLMLVFAVATHAVSSFPLYFQYIVTRLLLMSRETRVR